MNFLTRRLFVKCALSVALGLGVVMTTQAKADEPAKAADKIKIVLVGDSTVATKSGWGNGFIARLTDAAQGINRAVSGRSSKSFRDEGHWEKALAFKPDYVLIQFGHNDMPGKGPTRETDPKTTFPENLARYVDEARAQNAKPILVTSLTRRTFDGFESNVAYGFADGYDNLDLNMIWGNTWDTGGVYFANFTKSAIRSAGASDV